MESWARWTGIILVAAALLRALLLVSHDPIAGYANVGAAEGTRACITGSSGCYLSAEAALDGTVAAVARAAGADVERIPLRWIGLVKLALLFGTAFAIAAMLMDRPAASVAHGLVVLLVLADPVVTFWMNTLFREFLAIWAFYAVVACACVLAITDRVTVPWSLLFAALAVLAFAREHDAVLGILLVAIAWPWLWHRSPRLTSAVALTVLALWVAAFVVLQREGTPRPFALDIGGALRALASLQVVIPDIGRLEGAREIAASELPAWGLSPITLVTQALPPAAFIAIQVAVLLLLPISVLVLLVLRRWRGDPLAPLLVAASLGVIAWHSLAAALFGGPWNPAARFVTAHLAMWSALVVAAVGVPVLAKRWIAEPRDIPLELGVGAATVGAAAYAVLVVIPA